MSCKHKALQLMIYIRSYTWQAWRSY